MAAYSAIAKWLFSEGTGTSIADATGNGNTLTLTENSGTSAWATNNGSGVDITRTPNTASAPLLALVDVATNGNVASTINALNAGSGANELCAFFVMRLDSAAAGGSFVFKLGSPAGNGLFSMVVFNTGFGQIRFRNEDADGIGIAGVATFETSVLGSYAAFCVVCDSTQANANDRARIYRTTDGSTFTQIAITYSEINQDVYVDGLTVDDDISILDQVSGAANVDGAVFYFELGHGTPLQAEREAKMAAIYADNDADPDAASAPPELTAGPTASNITASGFDISGTTDADCTVSLVVVNFGDPQPNDAAFDASTETASATASVEWTINHVGT